MPFRVTPIGPTRRPRTRRRPDAKVPIEAARDALVVVAALEEHGPIRIRVRVFVELARIRPRELRHELEADDLFVYFWPFEDIGLISIVFFKRPTQARARAVNSLALSTTVPSYGP